jgi:hypothetical protein
MARLLIARRRAHSEPYRPVAGVLVALASACSLTAPSDGDLMDRPDRVDAGDSGAAGAAGNTLADAGHDGSAGSRDAGSDAAAPPQCVPACSAKQLCVVEGATARCTAPAEALDGQRWELPCGELYGTNQWNCRSWPAGTTVCPPQGHTPVDRRVTFGGQANVTYDVTLRFRGIVEPKIYSGGIADGSFYIGGGPAANSENYNSYGFTLADPPKNYFLNYQENKGDYVFAFDYQRTLAIKGQTEVRLFATAPTCGLLLNCQNMSTAPNCTPYAVPGGGPPAYNGHFIQMDVVAVKRR